MEGNVRFVSIPNEMWNYTVDDPVIPYTFEVFMQRPPTVFFRKRLKNELLHHL